MFTIFRKLECNDNEIVRLIGLNNDRAFTEAYKCIKRLYFPMIKGFLIKKGMYSIDKQSDILSDAILIFRGKIIEGGYKKGDTKISTYLIEIIKYLILDDRKKQVLKGHD